MLAAMADNPQRVVDWRWRRAMGVLDGTQPAASRSMDGVDGYAWIRRATAFKRRLDAAENDVQRWHLARQQGPIFWAHHIFESESLRWSIEARILARCTDWEISFATAQPVAVIAAYEALFFNVRSKLQHPDYIKHCVLGPSVYRGLSERDYDLLWKLYGYFYGPHMVDALTSLCVAPTWCPGQENVSDAIQADAIGTMKLKAAIAAKTVPVGGNQLDLLGAFNQFVEIERTTDSTSQSKDVVMGQIGAMLAAFPFNIAGNDPTRKHQSVPLTPAHAFDNTAVELSYSENIQLSFGQSLPNAGMLAQLQFPAAQRRLESNSQEAGRA